MFFFSRIALHPPKIVFCFDFLNFWWTGSGAMVPPETFALSNFKLDLKIFFHHLCTSGDETSSFLHIIWAYFLKFHSLTILCIKISYHGARSCLFPLLHPSLLKLYDI